MEVEKGKFHGALSLNKELQASTDSLEKNYSPQGMSPNLIDQCRVLSLETIYKQPTTESAGFIYMYYTHTHSHTCQI